MLLRQECNVHFGEPGEGFLEREDPAEFVLCVLEDCTQSYFPGNPSNYSGTLAQEIIRFGGVDQRENPSLDYLKALKKISRMGKGLDLEIPVRFYYLLAPLDSLKTIVMAERTVHEEWRTYEQSPKKKEDAAPGCLRCTLVLKPTIVDFNDFTLVEDMVKQVKEMVAHNTHFSQLSLWLERYRGCVSKDVIGQLMALLLATTESTSWGAGESCSLGDSSMESTTLPIGTLHLECPDSLENFEMEGVCSAMTVNRTTTKASLRLEMDPDNPATSRHWWKWLAYALFSKRARACSSLEELSLISIGSMSVQGVEEFSVILRSEHPEEDLYGCPRGKLDERNAVLKKGVPVYWWLNNRGMPRRGSGPLSFKPDRASIRTFSDDGEGELVNAMVPGFGRCQVRRSDLLFADIGVEDSGTCGVTSLHLGFNRFDPFEASGLPQFLSVVGPSLKFLALNNIRDEIHDSAVLRSCPNLEELALYGVDLRLNFADYRVSNLPLPEITYNWDDVVALSTRLGIQTTQ